MITVFLHALVLGVWLALLVAIWRSVQRRSSLLGGLVLAGILVRLVTGVGLFAISWFNLPVLTSLHTGDGFWRIAPDAKMYYQLGAEATRYGLAVIDGDSPSPAFLRLLVAWMHLVGVHPLSPILLNILLYAGIAWLLARAAADPREPASERGVAIALGAVSFSPALLICSAQGLKDVFFVLLIVVAAITLRATLSRFSAAPPRFTWLLAVTLLLGVVVFELGGLRAYYAVFLIAALSTTLGWIALTRAGSRKAACGWAVVMVPALWLAFALGAGPYYDFYDDILRATFPVIDRILPEDAATPRLTAARSLQTVREGFVESGGATNFGRLRPYREDATAWETFVDQAAALMTGLLAIAVPISVLRLLSIVTFDGGRGFLLITDADTIFFLGTAAVVLWHLRRRPAPIGAQQAFALFVGVLTTLSAILLAYVVTNFGTLFRLRLMVFTTVWLLPLAVPAALPFRVPAAITKFSSKRRVAARRTGRSAHLVSRLLP